jgi:hypothetical protein
MPYDVTHCVGQDCPLKETCLRYTAAIVGRQDFFTSAPYNFLTHSCELFWDDRPTELAIRQLAYALWQNSGDHQNNALADWSQARQQLIDNLRNS